MQNKYYSRRAYFSSQSKAFCLVYIYQVRCLQDYGEFETEAGDMVMLTLNSEHYLPQSECEHLIKQGVLQHVG